MNNSYQGQYKDQYKDPLATTKKLLLPTYAVGIVGGSAYAGHALAGHAVNASQKANLSSRVNKVKLRNFANNARVGGAVAGGALAAGGIYAAKKHYDRKKAEFQAKHPRFF